MTSGVERGGRLAGARQVHGEDAALPRLVENGLVGFGRNGAKPVHPADVVDSVHRSSGGGDCLIRVFIVGLRVPPEYSSTGLVLHEPGPSAPVDNWMVQQEFCAMKQT